jgi:hypothetical protein
MNSTTESEKSMSPAAEGLTGKFSNLNFPASFLKFPEKFCYEKYV